MLRSTHRPRNASLRGPLLATLVASSAVLVWDASGLDMALARLAGNAGGFPLKHAWWLADVLHDDARVVAWLAALALCLSVAWPLGFMKRVSLAARVQWATTALVAVGVVSLVKSASATSCPWDLQEFGGVARHLSHWSPLADGGPGRCFPAGHASSGFAFVGGFLALRGEHPFAARVALAGSLLAGVVLGFAQQWRGAHFMSHTLWTAWLCWVVALALEIAVPWEAIA